MSEVVYESEACTVSRRLALLPATWSAFGWLACAANSEWEWAKLFGSIVVLLVVFALSAPPLPVKGGQPGIKAGQGTRKD